MTTSASDQAYVSTGRSRGFRVAAAALLRSLIEAGVLVLVCVSPWAFASVEAEFEFLLYVGLSILLTLWGIRTLLLGEFRWAKCPVAVCLAGLFLIGTCQLVPWPSAILQWIAPGTVRLYGQLLPAEHELIRGAEETGDFATRPGTTLSLYATATRRELLRLLAVFLLFSLVRNNAGGARALWRFSIVALLNATLLAYLGIAQFLSAPPNTVYWRIQSPGLVFGPFINRNHFAFYVDVCVGLGLGLLSWSSSPWRYGTRVRAPLRELFSNPKLLWITGAVAVMVASSLVCLSRGGFLALIGASIVCVLLRRRGVNRFLRFEFVLPLLLCFGLVLWFGIDRVMERYGRLWTEARLREGRTELWRDSMRIARDFPVWGTGYGTFQYIEPLYRRDVSSTINEHAHNEYLEAAVEGGVFRFIVSFLSIALLARLGYRAYRRHEESWVGGLVMGALFGLATVVLHSAVEFGLHVPAIVVLVTVLAALICELGGSESSAETRPDDQELKTSPDEYVLRWHGVAPALAAAMCLALGLTLVVGGWTPGRVQILRRAATRWADKTGAVFEERRIACLEAAVSVAPDLARLRVEAGQAHLDVMHQQIDRLEEAEPVDAQEMAGALERLNREHSLPALAHYLAARDLCPLLGEPHLQIAAHISLLDRADHQTAYFERAKMLIPFDPAVWYLSGLYELLDGHQASAWKSWRRALELSDTFLQEITKTSAAVLSDEDLISLVLPDRADILVRTAFYRYPNAHESDQRRPFFEKAQAVLEKQQVGSMDAEKWYMQAIVERALGNWQAALEAYASAVDRKPNDVDWRYEFAESLFEQQRFDDSHRELVTILRQRPDHARARELYNKVSRVRAESK